MNTGAMELNIKKMGPVDRGGFNPVVCAVGAVLGAAKGALAGGAIGLAGGPEGTAAGAVVGALIGGARMDNSRFGQVANRLNKMMDAEIPDSVNIIVLTGGIKLNGARSL